MLKRVFTRIGGPTSFLLVIGLLAFAAGVTAVYLRSTLLADLPDIGGLPQRFNTPSVRINDRNGRLLYEVLPEEGGRHAVLMIDQIPLVLRQATIATEDRTFYTNPGVDLLGVFRAVWINLRGGGTLAGGSTITQQVARNLLLSAGERGERSLRRKLREGYLAWQLTRRFSKDEILAMYLNQTYYGGMAYGVEAAAQTYFAKPANRLDLAESALLAGLPQAPALYNPFTDLEAAKARQQVVLSLLERDEYITPEQRSLAEREVLVLAEQPYPIEAPHFVMQVRNQIDQLFTPDQVYASGGLEVRTTLDLNWQKLAEQAVRRQVSNLQTSEDGLGHNVHNAALVALDPASGDVLALVGSPDYFDSQNAGAVNMVLSPRQPGSALKPLVYATAFDPAAPGGGWSAATMLLDVQTSFSTVEGEAYTPENYDRREHGPVLAREALASSLNIPAVLALDHIGLDNLFRLTSRLGVDIQGDPQEYDLSLALGGGAVRLLDLTAAYGAFATGGYRVEPRWILAVSDFQGRPLYTVSPPGLSRVLDERVAWLISDILSDNDARRLGFGGGSVLRLDRPAAVKTGTTSNFHDNWTVGYTPELVVGVWSGNTTYEPMRDVNGLTGAAPVWHQFMRSVLAGRPSSEFQRPTGLVQVEICALSGLLPSAECPYRRLEWFIEGTQPRQMDQFYRTVELDADTGRLAAEDTPSNRRMRRVALDLPAPAWLWARQQGVLLYADLQAGVATVNQTGAPAKVQLPYGALNLVSPATGSQYRTSISLDAKAQRILVEATGNPDLKQVNLVVDGVTIASLGEGPYRAWWALVHGEHTAWAEAILPDGTRISSPVVTFNVIQ